MRCGKDKRNLIRAVVNYKLLRYNYEAGCVVRNVLNIFFKNNKSVFFSRRRGTDTGNGFILAYDMKNNVITLLYPTTTGRMAVLFDCVIFPEFSKFDTCI